MEGTFSTIGTFLKTLWSKIKNFGKPIFDKLKLFVQTNFPWAQKILHKGLGFLATNPITQIAVPAVALAGTVGGAIALINKIRSKKGKSKLNQQEEDKLEDTLENKKDEMEKVNKILKAS